MYFNLQLVSSKFVLKYNKGFVIFVVLMHLTVGVILKYVSVPYMYHCSIDIHLSTHVFAIVENVLFQTSYCFILIWGGQCWHRILCITHLGARTIPNSSTIIAITSCVWNNMKLAHPMTFCHLHILYSSGRFTICCKLLNINNWNVPNTHGCCQRFL